MNIARFVCAYVHGALTHNRGEHTVNTKDDQNTRLHFICTNIMCIQYTHTLHMCESVCIATKWQTFSRFKHTIFRCTFVRSFVKIYIFIYILNIHVMCEYTSHTHTHTLYSLYYSSKLYYINAIQNYIWKYMLKIEGEQEDETQSEKQRLRGKNRQSIRLNKRASQRRLWAMNFSRISDK